MSKAEWPLLDFPPWGLGRFHSWTLNSANTETLKTHRSRFTLCFYEISALGNRARCILASSKRIKFKWDTVTSWATLMPGWKGHDSYPETFSVSLTSFFTCFTLSCQNISAAEAVSNPFSFPVSSRNRRSDNGKNTHTHTHTGDLMDEA